MGKSWLTINIGGKCGKKVQLLIVEAEDQDRHIGTVGSSALRRGIPKSVLK